MRPFLTSDDHRNSRSGNPKFISKVSLANNAPNIPSPDFRNLSLGQFCHRFLTSVLNRFRMFKGSAFFAAWASAFRYHIHRIIKNRSEEKMIRIAAGWIITTMQHKFAIWYRAIREEKRHSVTHKCFAAWQSVKLDSPISPMVSVKFPRPTFIWSALINLVPKSQCLFICDLFHKKTARRASAQAALSCCHEIGKSARASSQAVNGITPHLFA